MNSEVSMMSPRAKKLLWLFVYFAVGGFLMHALVMSINAATGLSHVHYGDADGDMVSMIASPAMIPMIAAYGVLTSLCFALYHSRRRAFAERERAHVEVVHAATTIDTLSALSAVIIDLVATQNNRIIHWSAGKERRGNQVSPAVKEASRNISRVLRELSVYMVELTPRDRSDERRLRRHDILNHFVAQLEERAHAVMTESDAETQNILQKEVTARE